MKFILNKPVETRAPSIVVDGTLKPGVNRFRLVVIDAAGNKSKPTVVDVLVSRSIRPGLVVDPNLRIVPPRQPVPINPRRIPRRPRT